MGETSIEERAARYDVVAKVTLRSVTTTVEVIARNPIGDTAYAGALEFKFKVLEYLAGSGGSEIVGVAYENNLFDTQAEALAILPGLLASWNTRWDDREAIVFFERSPEILPSTAQEGRYWLGELGFSGYSNSPDSFTITSDYNKAWLPAASSGGASSAAGASPGGGDQLFLMDDPTKASSQGASGAAGSTTTITLSELRKRIGAVDTEVRAGDGSEEYRKCIWAKYSVEEEVRREIESKGSAYHRTDHELASGLPAGSVVYGDRRGVAMGYPPTNLGQYWLEGRDKDLFVAQAVDSEPKDWWGNGVINSVIYSRELSTARPLPMGEYRFYFNALPAERVICSGHVELERNTREWFVNVSSPREVLHEAFFDPVVNTTTSAVGADGSLGVLKPTDFRVTGYSGFRRVTSTTTMKALYWENNKVRMEFAGSAPRTELSGSFMDVIGLDGKVSLTLDFNKSSLSSDGKSLVWNQSKQPWKVGDKLMLRIREGMAGIGGEPGASGSDAGR